MLTPCAKGHMLLTPISTDLYVQRQLQRLVQKHFELSPTPMDTGSPLPEGSPLPVGSPLAALRREVAMREAELQDLQELVKQCDEAWPQHEVPP